jgi:ribosomal protein S26
MFVIFKVCGKNKHSSTFQTIFHCDQDVSNVAKTKNIYPTAFQNTADENIQNNNCGPFAWLQYTVTSLRKENFFLCGLFYDAVSS